MKIQSLFTCLVVLFTVTTAKPVERRGIAGDIVDTVNKLLHHGIGTFFDPESEGGSQGACGPFADENSQIVAMVSILYVSIDDQYAKYSTERCAIW
jgi:hypothetical protein